MYPFDLPKYPPGTPFGPRTQRTLTTSGGVTVIVDETPPPPPPPEPPPPKPGPAPTYAIIFPPGQSLAERQAFFATLCNQHRAFIEWLLIVEGILPESAKDLRQNVLVILCDRVSGQETIENARAFLRGVIKREAMAHKRRMKHRAQGEPDEDAAVYEGPDPHAEAERAEHRAMLQRYLARLPEQDARMVWLADIEEQTLDQIVAAVGLPRSTVARRLDSAREKLAEMALASARATELAQQRRWAR